MDALRGFERLYAESGNAATWDRSVNLLAGECLGGGTVVNYCTSFRTPDDVRAEWAAAGVPWFTQDEYTRSLDACARALRQSGAQSHFGARAGCCSVDFYH